MKSLLQPATLGNLPLANRIAMAPVTRSRAGTAGIPDELTAQYYQQRASAGLLISEATNISPASAAFELAPGIHTPEQAAGWARVAQAVHWEGGKLFMQLWHGGRVGSHALLDGQAPLSPSGVNDDLHLLQVYGMLRNGRYTRIAASPSRAMERDEIINVIGEFGTAASNALQAGLDGVEIHAANGYLPQQFLSPHVNRRTDDFGGSIENRMRFLRLVLESVLLSMPAARIGVRISPFAAYNNAGGDAMETYARVLRMLDEYGVGYVHAADTNAWGGTPDMDRLLALVRANYRGFVIANGGLAPDAADELLRSGRADMVSFGRQFIANPDLVRRIARGGPYNTPDPFTFYGGGAQGYVDYPALAA